MLWARPSFRSSRSNWPNPLSCSVWHAVPQHPSPRQHVAPQVTAGAGQAQCLATQVCPVGQASPHPPQFDVSVARLVQVVPQRSGLAAGQTQLPPVHVCVA
jgi:hypothetical protein